MNGSEPQSPPVQFVTLRSGMTLPLPAILLALDLESRGLKIRADGDGLSVGPRERLTEDDREQIRYWREDLRAIVTASEVVD